MFRAARSEDRPRAPVHDMSARQLEARQDVLFSGNDEDVGKSIVSHDEQGGGPGPINPGRGRFRVGP